jgi:uncharacterized protein (DUF2236 family)
VARSPYRRKPGPGNTRLDGSRRDRTQRQIIDEAEFERALARLRETTADPTAGVFGPASALWRVDREAAVFLGAGRALLLQLAHPWVAAAVAEHGRALADPIGRFHRTFAVVLTMVFGSLDQALAAARALHARHRAITGLLGETLGRFPAGSPYAANDAAALAWVHATLTETALLAHDLVLPPLDAAARERYWTESRRFALFFGIPQAVLPADWAGFAAATSAALDSDMLAVGVAARRYADELFFGRRWWLRPPFWYRALTAQLLPARLRDAFGLAYGGREAAAAARALSRLHRLYPLLPSALRHVGPYREAGARLAGRARPDLATRLGNRFWIGRPRMPY